MTAITIESLQGDRRRGRTEKGVHLLVFIAAGCSIVVSALIVASLVREAWTFISQVDKSLLWTSGWFPRRNLYDIKTLVVASVLVTGIGMLLAVPVGLGAGIYLSEYAKPRARRIIKPILEMLAGIPSVVIGFFVLTFISPEIVQRVFEATPQQTLLAAGLGIGILIIPLVASISEDAFRAVPRALREASYGMGAKKITTTVRVVIPAAVSGLVASFIIAISRALGETMVVFIAAGRSGGAEYTANPFEGGLTMTAGMASVAAGTDNVVGAGLTFQSLFFIGLLLFVLTLLLNLLGERFVRRVRQRY